MPYRIIKREKKPGLTVGLFDTRIPKPGIPLEVGREKVLLSQPENHCLVMGATGRGKTRRVIFPSVILAARAGQSLIVLDPKGEIYRNTAEEVRKCGHEVKVLNLRSPLCGDRWSPLSLVESYYKAGDKSRAVLLLKEVADIVIQSIASSRDRYWEEAAKDTFLGFSLLCLENDRKLTFDGVYGLVNEYFHATDSEKENFRSNLNSLADSYHRISTLVNLRTDVTSSCVVSEFNSAIGRFADQEDVRDLLHESDFDLADIGKSLTALYIVIPDESTTLHMIAGLFISQSYCELVHHADSREENRLQIGVTYVIDEFGTIPGNDWPSKLTAARSRGIRFVLALQTVDQLSLRFGEHGAHTIISNCRTIEYLGGKDIGMMAFISELSGEVTENGFRRPRMTVDGLATMETGQAVVISDGERPRMTNLPDWSAWRIESRAELSQKKREVLPVEKPFLCQFIDQPDEDCEGGICPAESTAVTIREILDRLTSEDGMKLLDELCPPLSPEEQEQAERCLGIKVSDDEVPF